MGAEVSTQHFTREERRLYRERLAEHLDSLATLVHRGVFHDASRIGLELELNLVDEEQRPALNNQEVLDAIADPAFQTEIGAYNIEFNHPALKIRGRGLMDLEDNLREELDRAQSRAETLGTGIVMAGILPTLGRDFGTSGEWISSGERYAALNSQILAARGEDVLIDITGVERLRFHAENIAPEAACTSTQLHVQVSPERFADTWNAAQIIAAPQVALAANSPIFMGKLLWAESRIEVFKQAIDTRPPELRNQGVRPRVWFGERWITSVLDLFEENVRYFPALLPELSGDPARQVDGVPTLDELRLHNGTVYRWNRPIYDPSGGKPHLRIENRLLPAGPTVTDTVANAAFFFGLIRVLRNAERPLWTRMAFSTASENFLNCARYGLETTVYWPGLGEIPVVELILRHLMPMVEQGLEELGVDAEVADRYLTVLRQRCITEQTGSRWLARGLRAREECGLERGAALRDLVAGYSRHMHEGSPVHSWPLD
jgi:gamma-glutamyl:cysteine ligase YbdK (ATP-grasp superfamily)